MDGSEIAESVLRRVPALFEDPATEITLLAVVDPRQQIDLTGPSLVAEEAKRAQAYLEKTAPKIHGGENVNRRVERGVPAEVILDVADAIAASHICMATHGRSGVSRMMNGSVTEKVVRAAKQPVIVVPSVDRSGSSPKTDDRSWGFSSGIVALDGSRRAMQIIPHVAAWASQFESEMTIVLVVEKGASDEVAETAKQHVEGAKKLFEKAGVTVSDVILNGSPARELVQHAASKNHDFIMMTTHGRTGVSRWMLGSVAARVVRSTTVPIVVVRSVPLDETG